MADPDDTAPHGGRTHTLGAHTLVDVGEMIKRTRDDMHETKAEMQGLVGVVMRHDAQLVELMPLVRAAVVPQSRAIRVAALVAAGALVVMALAFVTLVARTSSADSAPRVQATAQR